MLCLGFYLTRKKDARVEEEIIHVAFQKESSMWLVRRNLPHGLSEGIFHVACQEESSMWLVRRSFPLLPWFWPNLPGNAYTYILTPGQYLIMVCI